jgi:hypothetical protein
MDATVISASRSRRPAGHRLAGLGALALVATGIIAGCGGSSKPAYCADVTTFKNSVQQLKHVSSPSDLVSQVKTISSTGQTAVSSVKTGFAPQTTAVKSSLSALEASVKQLSSSSTRASAIVAIPAQAQAVVTAADNFANAAKSNCS